MASFTEVDAAGQFSDDDQIEPSFDDLRLQRGCVGELFKYGCRADGWADFYLPEGKWTHLLTGETVAGGGWRRGQYDFHSLPLFVREGAVIPMGAVDTRPDYDFADEPDEDARFFAEERIAAETKENSPFAMVRITNLPEFLRPVRLHASCPGSRTRLFRFRDPQIPYNDGIWRWTLSGNGSSLRKLPDRESCTAKELESTGSLPDMTPGALAQWAFSYAASPADVPWLKEAEPAGAAYFDEET